MGNDGKLKSRYSIGHNYLSKEENNGNKYYYCYDNHGDVKLLTDNKGNVVKNYVYDIYGKEDNSNQAQGIQNPIRYAGQYYDAESGLYYLRARYYSPEIMRFISEDTYKGKIKNPLSLNYYSYCEGNPVRYFDETGNFKQDLHYDKTLKWANYMEFPEEYAKIMAEANNLVDSGGTDPVKKAYNEYAQSWRFNTNEDGEIDSRIQHYNNCYVQAISLLKNGDINEAFRVFGRGLHALQDTVSHTADVVGRVESDFLGKKITWFYFHYSFGVDEIDDGSKAGEERLRKVQDLTLKELKYFNTMYEFYCKGNFPSPYEEIEF